MEKGFDICYSTAHETSREPARIGAATPTRCRVARIGRQPFVGGACRGRFGEFGAPLVSGLPEKRPSRALPSTDAGTPAETFGLAAQATAGVAPARSASRRIPHGALDAETHGRSNREDVWREVSSGACVVAFVTSGLELSEARASRSRERRRAHRALASSTLGAYKKTPAGKAVASSFWMRAASCFSRWCAGRGHPRERRPFCGLGIDMTDCRSLTRSPWPLTDDELACTGRSTPRISGGRTWWVSCDISAAACGERSCSSGIGATATEVDRCATTWSVMP